MRRWHLALRIVLVLSLSIVGFCTWRISSDLPQRTANDYAWVADASPTELQTMAPGRFGMLRPDSEDGIEDYRLTAARKISANHDAVLGSLVSLGGYALAAAIVSILFSLALRPSRVSTATNLPDFDGSNHAELP